MSELALYGYFRSSAAYRVRIALNHKKLNFDYRAVHLAKGHQLEEDFLKINPMGEVPCLVHGHRTLSQSIAIICYLDEVWPHPPLFPSSSYQKAYVLQLCEHINSGLHPVINLKVQKEIAKRYGVSDEGKKEWVRFWVESGLEKFEKIIKPQAGQFCFGDEVTAADLYLVPQMFNARRFEADLNKFPFLVEIEQRCLTLDSFRRAHPERQPDYSP